MIHYEGSGLASRWDAWPMEYDWGNVVASNLLVNVKSSFPGVGVHIEFLADHDGV